MKPLSDDELEIIKDQESRRDTQILSIKRKERLAPTNDGIELSEGYDFDVNSTIMELAYSISELALSMNKEFGEGSASVFLSLIQEYYKLSTDNKQ